MMGQTRLQAVRKQLGYSADSVIRLLRGRAETLGLSVMSSTSLKTKLSRWENGHEQVSLPHYQRLFRDVYGRTNAELGFPDEPETEEATELRTRLKVARSIDAETVELFRRQVDHARHVDRKFGAASLLDQLRSHIKQVEDLLTFGTLSGQREALAGVLVEASTLAGWEALDRDAATQAWAHYERAKSAAREAGSTELLAHAIAEQSFVLVDIGETALAVDQLAEARALAERGAPPLLRAWLAAAHGEGLATIGQRADALHAFDTASSLLPNEVVHPKLPFLFLGGAHLDRWRGNALAKLGEPDAIDRLTDAMSRLPKEFARARSRILVDLAFAYAAAGDRDAAHSYARQARQLCKEIKSDRELRRLRSLVLPGAA